ncbi:acetate/propionate family kinase [Rhizobium ruizarguesonis]|uniref:acetate/propionate family kinase n=1 Tax=Rhizobium ruizarguesonis TaxID=2081791 RepID=UPI00102FB98B|nr:acetate/propionate family kinase [Rhizobium ruizarguesonis]TAY64447.1 acetate/propionate family kinase [Rhizobium ruizarguesonis]TAZ34414.1 acetate/propionate family kinase [Rhizobium ruizarguesonis]TBA62022.1 acetate/propionate family kinase [Rhizobium ruizarguesonis]TBB33066.1 acetate/propionate family kinase [Rhizobium ruizarguesonis]TBC69091.1 acetate/propionate family kinase [Rhizobium ruizarguesonis]
MDRVAVTFNAGSSSLKVGVFRLKEGLALRLGGGVATLGDQSRFTFRFSDGDEAVDLPSSTAIDARLVSQVVDCIVRRGFDPVVAGHRIVHGGQVFDGPVLLEPKVVLRMEDLTHLAPVHLPPALAIVRAVRSAYPDILQTASFDTAFHSSQSSLASRLAIPRELHDAGIRRYGFHGLSYKYVAGELRKHDPDLAAGRVICAHLGSGASLCGMVDGVSIDASMGFSPLDGIPMSTRPGSLDPGAVVHLLRNNFHDADSLEDFLYHRCGLLGVSGKSGEVRVLLEDFHPASREALDLFCFRIAGEIGRLAVSLGGVDAIVFTAGIGEHQPEIRNGVAHHLGWLGLSLSEPANKMNATVISSRESEIVALVIPTDEEQVIAEEAIEVVSRHRL